MTNMGDTFWGTMHISTMSAENAFFCLCNKGVTRSVAHRRMMLPCSAAQTDPEVHFDKKTKARFAHETADVIGEWYEHYLLLHAASADCLPCVQHWLSNGGDVTKGTMSNPAWTAASFAEHAKASRHGSYLWVSTCCMYYRFYTCDDS